MAPSMLVEIERMPLTSNGKLDRKALPAPEWGREQTEPEGERSPIEEIVAGAYRQALGREEVGVKSHFFELGGHSLLATRLVSQLREAFSVELAVREVFEHPRVEELARVVEAAMRRDQGTMAPPIRRVERSGALPLSFAQQRLWFLDQMEPGDTSYNCPMAVRMMGDLDIKALKQTLSAISRRHESLRTRFETKGGQAVQVIGEAGIMNLPIVELSSIGGSARELEVQRLAMEEAQSPFDLARGPLQRARLLRVAEHNYVALFTMHHIISDGWSLGILIKEVAVLYEAFTKGDVYPLPDLNIQYSDYAVWQREWLQGEVLDGQLSYWR